ncbi:GNAT family N-acetyltransferase [Vibrio maritimus]|uniref:GNAT family N-acetyltransferase n=1 Tax=Vibrio maritimus TaxID=990268 RepID=UPI001F471340|nr:GNAT family N-acetyltransferase [Vibrio maritimus]
MTHSLTFQSFFNSLFVDMQGSTNLCQINNKSAQCATFELNNAQLWLPLSYCSPTGRHRYEGTLYLNQDDHCQSLSFPEALDWVLANYDDGDAAKRDRLIQRVGASDEYIQRASLSKQKRGTGEPVTFIDSEQSLIGGHSMHPTPKSCAPLTQEEQAVYLPEFENSFAIEWFSVAKERLMSESVGESAHSKLETLFKLSIADSKRPNIAESHVAFPMHPLQAKAWRESDDFAAMGSDMVDLNISSAGWRATSSTRAIYHPDMPWMLKVSLPIKLTNSLRLLSVKEAKRGILFSRLLANEAGHELAQRLPTTTFIEEPAWATVTNPQGEGLDLPLISLRDNPFFAEKRTQLASAAVNEDQTHLLATVNQVCVGQQQAQVVSWIEQVAQREGISQHQAACDWIGAFMQNVIAPLCVARSDYGVVMLAHQQNILLRVDNGMPAGMMYRDCQGSGVTELALERFASVFEGEKPEYFMEGEFVNPYLAYYLIGNSLINTVAAIAASGMVTEQVLYQVCRERLAALAAASPVDSSFYSYLLNSDTLHWKRNFLCFVEEHNEATLSDPTKIYREIPNPLSEGALPDCVKPLPDGSDVAIYPLAINQWSLKTNGIERGLLNVHETNGVISVNVDTDDPLIYWSGVEHAFFALDCQQITCEHAPEFVRGCLDTEQRMTRASFLEHAPIWHHPDDNPTEENRLEASNGLTHPPRPIKPVDVFYRRYIYGMNKVLTFRKASLSRDLECFNRWHNDPAISPVWELEGSHQDHIDYLTKMESDPHQFPVIGEFDGVPFGYFEIYWTPEDRLGPYYQAQDFDRGVHMLSANPRFRGWRYFSVWSRGIVHYCFLVNSHTNNVMGEPRADNKKVLALTERIGFEHLFDFDFPHKRAAMLQCKRERFFEFYTSQAR